jgi:Sugar (and other) transporter
VTFISTVLAIFFNIFINPIALTAIAWKYYIVFVAVLISMILTVYFFYPETRGYSLEQIAVIFDGEDAEVLAPAEIKERTESMTVQTQQVKKVAHDHVEEQSESD